MPNWPPGYVLGSDGSMPVEPLPRPRVLDTVWMIARTADPVSVIYAAPGASATEAWANVLNQQPLTGYTRKVWKTKGYRAVQVELRSLKP